MTTPRPSEIVHLPLHYVHMRNSIKTASISQPDGLETGRALGNCYSLLDKYIFGTHSNLEKHVIYLLDCNSSAELL